MLIRILIEYQFPAINNQIKMKILFLILILSLNLVFSKDLLWKVENGDATLYITGSIHYGKDDFYPLPNSLDSTFALSDKLVLEINLDSIRKKAMLMARFTMLERGEYLDSQLSEETIKRIRETADVVGFPYNQLQIMKPWAVAMTLSQMILQNKGMSPGNGVDKYFFDKAKQSNKEIVQLETVESQLEVFDSFDELGEEFVLKSLESIETEIDLVDEMIAAWKDADLEALDKLLNDDSGSDKYKEINYKMLDQRNFQMMDKIDEFLKTDKTYFVVVGAGHLSGENGLINLLSKKYNIIQY